MTAMEFIDVRKSSDLVIRAVSRKSGLLVGSPPFTTNATLSKYDKNRPCDDARLPKECCSRPARLIVCEHSGRWAVALRRELTGVDGFLTKWPLEETRSVAECRQRLLQSPASFAIVELADGNVERLLQLLSDMPWRFPLARLATVVGNRDSHAYDRLARYELLIRQAGAVFFGSSLRSGESHGVRDLADIARRHLQQTPHPRLSLREEIWARLPWSTASVAHPNDFQT